MKRKFLAITAAAALLIGLLPQTAWGAAPTFSDVSADAWYHDVVVDAAQNGLVMGTEEGTFSPQETVTRGMMVTMLARTADAELTQAAAGYTDVPADAYYAPAVAWATEADIVSGNGDGTFAPENAVTREELAVMLMRTYTYLGHGPTGEWMVQLEYADLNELSDWALGAVAYCALQDIMTGGDGYFYPKAPLSRAEAAAVVSRLYGQRMDWLYADAVADAETVEPEEILPVTAITPESDMVTWNEAGDRVLLLTWHHYPESYPAGETATLSFGEVWTFTDKEIHAWYEKNHEGVTNWELRLEQLIGLPRDAEYTHVSGLWARPEDVVRPAYVPDITQSAMTDTFGEDVPQAFRDWFDGNIQWSYTDSAYPWTRLGYTYDWADNGTEFGLSEFLIQKDAEVEVAFTLTTDEFLASLAAE